MKSVTRNRVVASVAALATLASLGMASSAFAADQAVTLNAAEGATLTGHVFTFYKLADYADIVAANGKVSAFNAEIPADESGSTWAADAIKTYNAANSSAQISIPAGYDAAGAIVKLSDASDAAKLTGVVDELAKTAASANLPAKDVVTVTGSGTSQQVTLSEGVWVMVDTDGRPILMGTNTSQGSIDGMITSATIKTQSVTITKNMDKHIATVGDVVPYTVKLSLPAAKAGADKITLTDTATGVELDKSSFKAMVGTEDVTSKIIISSWADTGFTADATALLADNYYGKQLVITYNATIVANDSKNLIDADIHYGDGSDHKNEGGDGCKAGDPNCTEPNNGSSKSETIDLKKVDADNTATVLKGAYFKVQRDGKWQKRAQDAKGNYVWADAKDENDATAEITSDKGIAEFSGLGEGEWVFTETVAPAGYASAAIAKISVKVTIDKDGNMTYEGQGDNASLVGSGTVADKGSIEVKNTKSIASLPSTGIMIARTATITLALFATAGGLVLALRARKDNDEETYAA